MDMLNTKIILKDSLISLMETPRMRPFLFRTRFERSMVRLAAYAKEAQRPDLDALAIASLNKIKEIVDKSNTTADGELRSHALLVGDLQKMIEALQ